MKADPFQIDPFEGEGGAAPEASGPAVPPASESGKRGLRPIQAILVWPILIAACAYGLGHVVGGKLKARMKPSYKTSAVVQIDPVESYLVFTNKEWGQKSSPVYFNSYKKSIIGLFPTAPVLTKAVLKMDEKHPGWRGDASVEDSTHKVKRAVTITPGKQSALITLEGMHTNPEFAASLTNSLAEGMMDYLESKRAEGAERVMSELERESALLDERLESTRTELTQLLSKAGDAVMEDSRQNIYFERIKAIEEHRSKIARARSDAEGALDKARKMAELMMRPPDDTEIEAALDLDTSIHSARVREQYLREEAIKESAGLGPKHPKAMTARKAMEVAAERRIELEKETRTKLRERMIAERKHKAELLIFEAEHNLESGRKSEAGMAVTLEEARKDLARYIQLQTDSQRLRKGLAALTRQRVEIGSRINELRVELKAPARVLMAASAAVPGEPTKSKKAMLLHALYGVGAVVGCVLAIVIEGLRKKVRHPKDVSWIPGCVCSDLRKDRGLADPWAAVVPADVDQLVWVDWPRTASRRDRLVQGLAAAGREVGPELEITACEADEATRLARPGRLMIVQIPVKRARWDRVAQLARVLVDMEARVHLVVVPKGRRRSRTKSTSQPAEQTLELGRAA